MHHSVSKIFLASCILNQQLKIPYYHPHTMNDRKKMLQQEDNEQHYSILIIFSYFINIIAQHIKIRYYHSLFNNPEKYFDKFLTLCNIDEHTKIPYYHSPLTILGNFDKFLTPCKIVNILYYRSLCKIPYYHSRTVNDPEKTPQQEYDE